MLSLTNYIEKPEQLDTTAVQELHELVERYPYFQAARLLLLRGLYQLQSDNFGTELRQAALQVPDRARLFELIEGDKFKLEPETRVVREPEQTETVMPADRTQALIDSFLQRRPEESKPRRTRTVDATTDYIGYLLQTEDAPLPPPMATNSPHESDPVQRLTISAKQEQEGDDDSSTEWEDELTPLALEENEENATSETFFTETLARIYIKQGKYSKAIEIIRRLNLNYPKKSRYFADQIRFLEKLIINEQNININ